MQSVPEEDWKYMRKVKDELFGALAGRINRISLEILRDNRRTEIEKSRDLYRHVQDSDDIVARCFDDWRRSTLLERLLAMQCEGVLTGAHIAHLSPRTQEILKMVKERSSR